MLRLKPIIESFPNKTVIEDVLSRPSNTGGSQVGVGENYSPFDGLEEEIQRQFTGSQRDRFNFKEFLEYCSDRDLDPSRVKTRITMEYGMEIDKENAGYKTLEDMRDDERAVEEYVRSLMIGFKTDAKSTYKINKGLNNIRYISNDDGDMTDEREFLVDDQRVSLDSMKETLEQIPHLLKVIWNHSRQKNVHLISFLIAFENITKVEGKSWDRITPGDFAKYHTYMLTSKGAIKKEFDHSLDNRGEYYRYGREWVCGQYPNEPSYKAAKKLIALLNDIGCTFYDEEPRMFSEETMSKLICSYIPDNDEYVKQYGHLDPEIANALQPGNIFKARSELSFTSVKDVMVVRDCDKVQSIIDYIEAVCNMDPTIDSILNVDKTDLLLEYIRKVFYLEKGAEPELSTDMFTYANDILCLQGEFFTLPGKYVGACEHITNPTTILYKYGLVIVFEPDISKVYYSTVEHAINRANDGGRGYGYWHIL